MNLWLGVLCFFIDRIGGLKLEFQLQHQRNETWTSMTWKDGTWFGHLLSGYSLPMDDPNQKKEQNKEEGVGGTWKHAIKVSYEATQQAFPGGVILAHLYHKSFKSWQKNAVTSFLAEQNIQVGKPSDFF
ncbi:D-aminoacyl-tRNA deacylase-like isoform X2 [Dioscorea cayenensis subsp. rotundata]|uniref:D-aminoacyl-tRNA deacylase-like isoform X2 n=1 Tax=Dioscorea cayennensis subsp. rotundata TaxID=55577 RepID=A0AB40AYP3_DIOCR|nr:D-aminoacyl-tRNA deacylase-like isoform X2 [Dioscorea cayenensis subsp. rotundata]